MMAKVAYEILTDLELMALLNGGDEAAYTQIFFRYNRLLYTHAVKMLGNREEAKDIVQEIFANLWKNRTNFNLKTNLPGFLYTSIRNRILDQLARQTVASKYIEASDLHIPKFEDKTDYLVRTNELVAIIEKEVSLLPEKMQEIFKMSRNEGLSHKEIADKINLTEKTVKNQMNNALKILRSKLGLLLYFAFILSR